MARLTEESSTQIEALQQENHDLRVRLDNVERSMVSLIAVACTHSHAHNNTHTHTAFSQLSSC